MNVVPCFIPHLRSFGLLHLLFTGIHRFIRPGEDLRYRAVGSLPVLCHSKGHRHAAVLELRPAGAGAEAPLLRMELEKAAWDTLPNKESLTVSVAPEELLLLK